MAEKFHVYLVGGAVRDQLLNLPVKDRDWVIVGATPQDLLNQGYQQVGKNFPVFLHPQNKEEYALARTEHKAGNGYTGFICDFSADITLEQDLVRRDLTINAIAQDLAGNLYDPYHGVEDLEKRVLRHVSPAFSEDPVRVWAETEKALNEKNPEIYFEILRQVGALKVLFPELDALYGVPNPAKYHPEIDSFVHTMMVLQQATLLSEQVDCHKSAVRFAAICHDLGKACTPKQNWPHHHGHEKLGVAPTKSLCKRLKVPTYYQQLAELTCEYHSHVHKVFELRPETIVKLFNTFDVWRKPLRFMEFLLVCFADTRGRKGFEHIQYPQQEFAIALYQAALKVDIQSIIAAGFENKAIRDQLNRGRIFAVKQKRQEILPHFKL